MTIPVVTVAVTLVDQTGAPLAGAQVTAMPAAPIVYQGLVLPMVDSQVTDAAGKCTLTLVPTDVGITPTTYSFEIWPAYASQPTIFDGVSVPSTPSTTSLEELLGGSSTTTVIHYMAATQYMTGTAYIG